MTLCNNFNFSQLFQKQNIRILKSPSARLMFYSFPPVHVDKHRERKLNWPRQATNVSSKYLSYQAIVLYLIILIQHYGTFSPVILLARKPITNQIHHYGIHFYTPSCRMPVTSQPVLQQLPSLDTSGSAFHRPHIADVKRKDELISVPANCFVERVSKG